MAIVDDSLECANAIPWKRRGATFGLPFLSVCSDVLLVLIILLFLRANYTVYINKPLQELPELVLSEEMVNSVASSLRMKVDSILLMVHDITLGKDFRIFFKVVVCLWLLSVAGSFVSIYTLAYIGTIFSIIVPALYSKYEDREKMQLEKAKRALYGRFFCRFPDGESAADVYDRITGFRETLRADIDPGRFQLLHQRNPNLNVVIVSHGLTLGIFLMRWYKWTVSQF
ncbi:Reticulon-like protein [Drosera capensis]